MSSDLEHARRERDGDGKQTSLNQMIAQENLPSTVVSTAICVQAQTFSCVCSRFETARLPFQITHLVIQSTTFFGFYRL